MLFVMVHQLQYVRQLILYYFIVLLFNQFLSAENRVVSFQ